MNLRLAEPLPHLRLRIAFWSAAIVLGLVQAWAGRHVMNADGISYLDMADAYLRADWKMAINGYWSPLYSWLLGLAMFLLKPSPYWEFTVAHLVNFGIYIFALICFDFFLRALITYQQSTQDPTPQPATLPVWTWIMLGYTLFIFVSLQMITLQNVTPDMCTSALVYLAAGIIVQIRGGARSWSTFALLGVILGAAYLAKAVMLPLALVFLGTSLFVVRGFRQAVPRVLLALVLFFLLGALYFLPLSRAKGRWTFGESGRLAYAEYVSGVDQFVHWQGGIMGTGIPLHPTRKVLDVPPTYEFASPLGGTYPPWYDQSYWYEGAIARFNLKRQLDVLHLSANTYFDLLFSEQAALVVGILTLMIWGGQKKLLLERIRRQWHLLIPALSALGMYALIFVAPRYVGTFFVLLWAGLFSAVCISNSRISRKMVWSVTLAITMTLGGVCLRAVARDLIHALRYPAHPQWEVAEALHRLGVEPRDKVASIGNSFEAYWARLARVSIVAEIPSGGVDSFWASSSEVQSKAIRELAKPGTKVVVTDRLPPLTAPPGWVRLGQTSYYAYLLPERKTPVVSLIL